MKIDCTTHGLPREPDAVSQDAFRVQQRDECAIAVLADGLGGSKEGGVAARRAVDMMTDYFLARPQAWSPRRALTEFASQINRVLYLESQSRYSAPELLSTLSVVALEGDRLYGLNIGDSPIFLFHQGTLTRLSESHALGEPGLAHVLTRAVGLSETLEPYLFEASVDSGDLIVLCSDGVTTALTDEDITQLLKRGASARTIVNAANEVALKNEELRDDTTAIVVQVAERGWKSETQRRGVEVLNGLKAGEKIDGYTLVSSLQEGDRVWLAKQESGSQSVLKFPVLDARNDETRRDAFVREAWQAARIDSADFVRATVPKQGTLRYYEMEYVQAPTLRERLASGPLNVEEAVQLGRFLLRAGQFLLQRDLAHGDIKPENILVEKRESGTAYRLLDLGSVAELFSVTSRAGTASYLAPERFRGGALCERTEVFAIGVTLYEALGKAYPYGEIERFQTPSFETPARPLTRHNAVVPPWLDSVIRRALAADPTDRYQNFSEMLFDLEHPEAVPAFHRKDAPLLERNPLLFYKALSFGLAILCVFLLCRLSLR